MSRTTRVSFCSTLLAIGIVAGCNSSETRTPTPAAPAMPAGWNVVSDQVFEPADIKPVGDRLGAQVVALRNTDYEVDGKPVRLNTIVAATEADADAIMTNLRAMKPDDFLLRRELTLYEFVGANDVIPAMRAGKSHLQSN